MLSHFCYIFLHYQFFFLQLGEVPPHGLERHPIFSISNPICIKSLPCQFSESVCPRDVLPNNYFFFTINHKILMQNANDSNRQKPLFFLIKISNNFFWWSDSLAGNLPPPRKIFSIPMTAQMNPKASGYPRSDISAEKRVFTQLKEPGQNFPLSPPAKITKGLLLKKSVVQKYWVVHGCWGVASAPRCWGNASWEIAAYFLDLLLLLFILHAKRTKSF